MLKEHKLEAYMYAEQVWDDLTDLLHTYTRKDHSEAAYHICVTNSQLKTVHVSL